MEYATVCYTRLLRCLDLQSWDQKRAKLKPLSKRILYICILSHIVISLSLSLSMVPSLCGLSMLKTLNSVFNTCRFYKIILNTTCFGLNRPSSSVKNCLCFYKIRLNTTCFGLNRPSSSVKNCLYFYKILLNTTCFGLNWPSLSVNNLKHLFSTLVTF
jgi:hypothetical protein